MKKSVALAIAAAISLSSAGTALANNPFSDVPQGHWAYDAISQLERDGLVTGYGDGTYRGDRAMSRYEMATVVAQLDDANSENTEIVNKLRSEFATELYNLGVRVDKLEKNASTIKFTGDARIRYQSGGGSSSLMSFKDDNTARRGSRFQERVRINMTADVNEKIKFLGRIKFENTSNRKDASKTDSRSWSQDVWLDRAELVYKSGSFNARVGRILPTLGQGIIWSNSNPGDGALIGFTNKKIDIFGGVLDFSPTTGSSHGDSTNSQSSRNASVAHLGVKVTDKIAITAAYLNSHNNTTYPFELMAFGANAKLGSNWKLAGEWIKNNADISSGVKNSDQDTGYWLRLQYKNADMKKPGTYHIYAEYMSMGAYAVDSSAHPDILDIAPGNGTGKDGAKGYGIGITYVPAKNMNLQFVFHDLETKDGSKDYRNSYQFLTNFKF
ncbi:putative porin [Selenomonadales bacterium OttesenSCG-928-I06]|nr:putative porin [Selenomonadales bacterium OttesenSCG-928-I06]